MHIVMGGTGHVGSETAKALLRAGQEVGIVTRHPERATALGDAGARIIKADVNDIASLRAAFSLGRRAFLLNPPGDTKKDSDAIERQTVANILAALDGSGLEKLVAASVSGARPGERIGDLSVLWELEQGLVAQPIPAAINGAGYYMSNWDAQLESVRQTGVLATMFPADFKLPMVAPADLGKAAAERLMSSSEDIGVRPIEGPERYSSQDVADAFARALGRDVRVEVTPPGQVKQAFLQLGFSEEAAESYMRMTHATIKNRSEASNETWRGDITLEAYVQALAASMDNQQR
ncbi:NAD(P)H-binding protein [Altererythrobacter xixiisoli]|uniref:NAD(P)H-binding protein n=1 Tax=Croceibacterium xixiisoli TaxID=1476466 RepID=A0A6I4U1T6_9SPHN|nr:NmrA family NAD(P)-binding protein [Croceibacterium xixiisoli]MXP00584.1 NAD(P)H-binding protein [Croceibacterium xixiisoli]